MGEFLKAISELFAKSFRHLIPGFLGLIAILLFTDLSLSHSILKSIFDIKIVNISNINAEIIILIVFPLLFILSYVIGIFLDGLFHMLIEVHIILRIINKRRPKWNLNAWGTPKNDKQEIIFRELINDFYYYGEGFIKGSIIFFFYTIYFFFFNTQIIEKPLFAFKWYAIATCTTFFIVFLSSGYTSIKEFYRNFNSLVIEGDNNASKKKSD